MNLKTLTLVATLTTLFLTNILAHAQPLTDLAGVKDMEGLPRVANTKIVGYKFSEYDVAPFIVGVNEKRKAEKFEAEGERYRYVYAGVPTQTPLQLMRNYQKAFSQFGDYELKYECRSRTVCPDNFSNTVLWTSDQRMPVEVPGKDGFRFGYPPHSRDHYFYATVEREGVRYHVSGFALQMKLRAPVDAEVPLIHLEIIKEESFSDDLEFVSSAEMLDQIESTGSVALYGITFELDSAEITAASAETVQEIAKLLDGDPSLNVYVVGHTDNQGALAYNEDLSARRAAAVASALVSNHGIDAGRLTSRGVGPLAPVANNSSEEGQAKNRRVEIVKR